MSNNHQAIKCSTMPCIVNKNTQIREICKDVNLHHIGDLLTHDRFKIVTLSVGRNKSILTCDSHTPTGIIWKLLDIDDLNDVSITNVTNNQILQYDATINKWINSTNFESDKSYWVFLNQSKNISLSGYFLIDNFANSTGYAGYSSINTKNLSLVNFTRNVSVA